MIDLLRASSGRPRNLCFTRQHIDESLLHATPEPMLSPPNGAQEMSQMGHRAFAQPQQTNGVTLYEAGPPIEPMVPDSAHLNSTSFL